MATLLLRYFIYCTSICLTDVIRSFDSKLTREMIQWNAIFDSIRLNHNLWFARQYTRNANVREKWKSHSLLNEWCFIWLHKVITVCNCNCRFWLGARVWVYWNWAFKPNNRISSSIVPQHNMTNFQILFRCEGSPEQHCVFVQSNNKKRVEIKLMLRNFRLMMMKISIQVWKTKLNHMGAMRSKCGDSDFWMVKLIISICTHTHARVSAQVSESKSVLSCFYLYSIILLSMILDSDLFSLTTSFWFCSFASFIVQF